MPITRVGFVGLGRMGWPMAGHLVDAGFEVTVHDQDASAAEAFRAAHPAAVAADLSTLARNADAVVTMLPTSREVRAVLLGNGDTGLADRLAPGALVIDCSSSDPSETRRLGQGLAERSLAMVDAPVAGGVVFARDGTLDVLAGGSEDARARAGPVLAAFSQRVFPCGALGCAHAMKVLNNFVNAQALITYAEAMVIGRRFGIEAEVLDEALEAATTGRNHPFVKKVQRQVLTREFASGMALRLITKDVGLARDLADSLEVEAPIAAQCTALWERAAATLGADVDQTEVVRLWEQLAGVVLGAGGRDPR